jgi:hypothetical protein
MTIGALGFAALAAGVSAVWTGINHAQAIRAMAVSATITIDPAIKETFGPPPASAQPAMTAALAWAQWEQHAGATNTTIAPNTTVQLGLLTLPVGPYCGAECHGLIVKNRIAYTVLNQLAYGYRWSACPPGSTLPAVRCNSWIFLDASTGQMIDGVMPAQCGCANPGLGRRGLVIGFFLMVGGPAPGVSVRLPGRVIATSTTGRRFSVAVNSTGRFQFRLPPGTYQLTGYSPRVHVNHAEMRCVATHPVRLRAGQSKRRNVYCSVP